MKFYDKIFTEFNKNNQKIPQSYALVRNEAFSKFEKVGIPTLKQEDWKYTNLNFLNQIDFQFQVARKSFDVESFESKFELLNSTPYNLVMFVNGWLAQVRFVENDSAFAFERFEQLNIDNKIVEKQRKFSDFFYNDSNPFVYLNLIFFQEGLELVIPPNVELEYPLVIIYVYDSNVSLFTNSVSFVELGENSSARLLLSYLDLSEGEVFSNDVLNISLANNSKLDYNIFECDLAKVYGLNTTNVILGNSARFVSNVSSLNTNFMRNNLNVAFNGEGSEANLYGIYYVKNSEFIENRTLISHNVANCSSDENYKGILDDSARAVFNGKIYVARGAQKTNAYQSNKNLLLSNDARINTRPQLEIYADDVKCTHGATSGYLDLDMLFYIRSRGISSEKAKSLLLNSFFAENIERISITELRESLKEKIARKLKLEDIYFCSTIEELGTK